MVNRVHNEKISKNTKNNNGTLRKSHESVCKKVIVINLVNENAFDNFFNCFDESKNENRTSLEGIQKRMFGQADVIHQLKKLYYYCLLANVK